MTSVFADISDFTALAETIAPEGLTLEGVTAGPDALGQLAHVFCRMAREVYARDQRLKQQLQQLSIELDEARQVRHVAKITETEYFCQLQSEAQNRASFVARIWWEKGDAEPIWRGRIQRAASGDRRYFQTTPELLNFVEHYAEDLAQQPGAPPGGGLAHGQAGRRRPRRRRSVVCRPLGLFRESVGRCRGGRSTRAGSSGPPTVTRVVNPRYGGISLSVIQRVRPVV